MFRGLFVIREESRLAAVAVCVVILSAFMDPSYGFQRTSAFEVAAVKPNRSNEPASSLFSLGPGDAYVANFDLVLVKPGRSGPHLQVRSNGACPAQDPPSSRTGLQLPCGSVGPIPTSVPDRGRIGGKAVSLERLASYITNPFTGVDRPVFDKTGLTGTFDFSLEWVHPPDRSQLGPALDNAVPTFFEALEEQLGLALKSSRAPVAILVVEHIGRPSAN